MIEVRRIDLGEQLVLLDVCADIYHPTFEVAVDSRKNARFLPGSDLRRQHESIRRRTGTRRDDGYALERQLLRIGGGLAAPRESRADPPGGRSHPQGAPRG